MQTQRSRPRPVNLRYWTDPFMIVVLVGALAGFGGFMFWATTAQLAQGITASGVLAVEDQRREIQHLEGGIISNISIREGQSVDMGDVLMELRDANADARLRQVDADRASRAARLDRLEAALTGSDTLEFRRLAQIEGNSFDPAELIRVEAQVFRDQFAALAGERSLVEAKLDRLAAQRIALQTKVDGKEAELVTIRDEFDVQNRALAQQMGNISRLNTAKRSVTAAEAEIDVLKDESIVIDSSEKEALQELAQIDLAFRAEISTEMAVIRAEILGLEAERLALLDRQARQRIVAPVSGVVIDLAYPAIGGVVPGGETIFDLVPADKTWRVDVRFAPQDRDNLTQQRNVNLRFGTLDPINPPEIVGVLDLIAPDATEDPQTGTFYYAAEVSISETELAEIADFELSPGIPVEVFMDSGKTRTPLSYFLEPIEVMLRRGLRG